MLLRKKAFLNLFMICTFFATFLSFSVEITAAISKGFNNGNVSRARRLARPITLTAAGSLINENIPEESAEPTREQYNQYYQQINELNECVRRSCLSNSRSPIPGACFNATVVDSKIENNCKAQFNTIKVLHPSFELQAVIDVKTKLLADSKKACDGLNGSYSGGNPPNPYDGQFMSFGDCSIKVGYAPETLNKGENYAVRNVRVMDIGDSRACNMSSFGVNASDMLSDGNEKAAINMDIKMYGALASLGVEALGATGKVLVAQDFVKKNGQCVCTKELCGRGRRAVQNGNPYPVEEDDPPITKAECDAPEGEYAMDGFKWLDNFDKQMQAAGKERDTAYEALVSGCYQEKDSTGSSNMNAAAEIYMNSNNLSYADQENIMKEMELVGMSTPPSVLYKTQNNTPTIFSLESKIDGKLVVDPTSKLITAPGSSNNGKKLATTEVAKYLDSSTEKEECLCVATNKDFSYYEPWDNNTVMCFYNDNSVANIRIGKRGKNNIATYVEPAATPMVPGMSNAEGLTNASFTNAWQVGAIEAAEGAYSDAMLTQYVSNLAMMANVKNLQTNMTYMQKGVDANNNPIAMTNISDVTNAVNNRGSANSSFQGAQSAMSNMTALQGMQTKANNKYNTAAANYERAEANVAAADAKIASIADERTTVQGMADWNTAATSLLNGPELTTTLTTLLTSSSMREEAIEQTKQVRSGFCYIVTKDNKIGPVIARENESFKLDYGMQFK